MTYDVTVAYLFSQLPIYQRVGQAAYKADLSNTHALCDLLGHPENGFKSIHIAGTNGKGSTSHMLASILQEAGYKTGLYTSPHLKDFRERIRINGEMIPQQAVVDFVEKHKAGFEPINASFFEITVGMAFDYFRRQQVDIAVIETGLGGRLDSTNLITPEMSIITSIGMDHTQLLGNTIEKIAAEKAGIIKREIPVVVGDLPEAALQVMRQKSANEDSKLIETAHLPYPEFELQLKGAFQDKNARTVIAAVEELRNLGWNISDTHLAEGLKRTIDNTGLRGRWDVLQHSPFVIADIGHNEEGVTAIVEELHKLHYDHLHIVLGTVNDKEVDRILELFPSDATYYFCAADIPRALAAETLQIKANNLGRNGNIYPSVAAAKAAAISAAGYEDVVFIGGSAFVVAEAL